MTPAAGAEASKINEAIALKGDRHGIAAAGDGVRDDVTAELLHVASVCDLHPVPTVPNYHVVVGIVVVSLPLQVETGESQHN